MAGVSNIDYMGKEILYIDFRNLNEDETIEVFKKAKEIILRDNKNHISITNITDTYFTATVMKAANDFVKSTHHLLTKGGHNWYNRSKKSNFSECK